MRIDKRILGKRIGMNLEEKGNRENIGYIKGLLRKEIRKWDRVV